MSQVWSQWDSLRSLAEPMNTVERGAAQAGVVLYSTPKANFSRQNGTNGILPLMVPYLLEQRFQDLFGPVALPGDHVLTSSLESCQERRSPTLWIVFSLLITRRGLNTAPSSRSSASWGPEDGNCSQGSDHQPAPLPNQSKDRPSSLVLSLPCSLAE